MTDIQWMLAEVNWHMKILPGICVHLKHSVNIRAFSLRFPLFIKSNHWKFLEEKREK